MNNHRTEPSGERERGYRRYRAVHVHEGHVRLTDKVMLTRRGTRGLARFERTGWGRGEGRPQEASKEGEAARLVETALSG
jgi:hypothetical protein